MARRTARYAYRFVDQVPLWQPVRQVVQQLGGGRLKRTISHTFKGVVWLR